MPAVCVRQRGGQIVGFRFPELSWLLLFKVLRHDPEDAPALSSFLNMRYIQGSVRSIDDLHRMERGIRGNKEFGVPFVKGALSGQFTSVITQHRMMNHMRVGIGYKRIPEIIRRKCRPAVYNTSPRLREGTDNQLFR